MFTAMVTLVKIKLSCSQQKRILSQFYKMEKTNLCRFRKRQLHW